MLSIGRIQDIIVPLARKYGVERVYLFGSYARNEQKNTSDVDLRIDPGDLHGLHFAGFYVDVEEQLGCKVDILTTRQLSESFLKHIQGEEILLYDRQKYSAA